jgi:hypothetical protein
LSPLHEAVRHLSELDAQEASCVVLNVDRIDLLILILKSVYVLRLIREDIAVIDANANKCLPFPFHEIEQARVGLGYSISSFG